MAKTRTTLLTQGLNGRLGGLQYVQGPTGTIWKSMPPPRLKFTPGERAQQDRVRRIGAAWRGLGPTEIALWREFAQAALATVPAMQRTPVAPYNAFLALGTRLLQIDPQAVLPRTPPGSAFGGDAVTVVGEAWDTPSSKWLVLEEGAGGGGSRDLSPQPPLHLGDDAKGEAASRSCVVSFGGPSNEPSGEGESGLLYRADRPNSAGVVTELMAQQLLSVGRAPRPKGYVSQGFLAFTEGTLEAEVVCPPGWYALAVRFVRAGTGQDTAIFPLGLVAVGM